MLTRTVVPTCLISPPRPQSCSWLRSFFHLLGPSAHAVGPSGAAQRKSGGPGQHPRGTSGPERQRRTAEGGDFGARGIRPSGRGEKSSKGAVAARLVRLHGRHENPRDRTGHVRNPSIPVSCSLLAFPLLHFFCLFVRTATSCVDRAAGRR